MHAAKSAESRITLGYIERLAPNRLRCNAAAWSHLAIGETVLVDCDDDWTTFADVELGADGRPELACRSVVRQLGTVIVRRLQGAL